MRWMKRIFLTLFILFISLFIFCNLWIVRSTKGRIFSDLSKLPHHRIALVLGTSHRTIQQVIQIPSLRNELKQLLNFIKKARLII